MTDFKHKQEIIILLAKAIQNELSELERQKLEIWLQEKKENSILYQQILSPDFIYTKREQQKYFNSNTAYAKVCSILKSHSRKRLLYRISTIAASLLLLCGIGLYFVLHFSPSQTSDLAQKEIKPGNVKAELILAGGESIWLDGNSKDSIFNQPGAKVHNKGNRLNYQGIEEAEEIQYNLLKVPRGGEYSVVLQDSSVIHLNSASTLRYPVKFIGKERRVVLSGEGFFEIKKDEKHPFIVEVNGAEIEVLGTSFNVSSYEEEEKTEATLVEGSIRFSNNGQQVILQPGEQGSLNKNGNLQKRKVDIYPYIAWKNGQFVFQKQTLEEVMRMISRWYNINFIFEEENIKHISFSGNIKKYNEFQNVINMLELTGGLDFRIEGRTIYITAK